MQWRSVNAMKVSQKKKDKMKHNGQQDNTQKIKDWGTRTPIKTGVNSDAPEESAVPTPQEASIV